MALNDTDKAKLQEMFKPPRFERKCINWPMCMCQKKCANEDTPGTQYQMGLA